MEPSLDVEPRLAPVLVVLVGVSAVLLAVILFLVEVLPPDPPSVSPALAAQFFQSSLLFPEPTERTIFLASLALLPPVALIGAWLARRPTRWTAMTSLNVFLLASLAVTTLISSSATRQMMDVHRDTTPLWGALLAAVLCLPRSSGPSWLDIHDGRYTRVAVAFVLVLAAYHTFSWRTLDIHSLHASWRHIYHLDAAMYSTSQAVAGKLPLADYSSQYGLFGSILAPWFRTIGLSVLSFTLTMNVLQFVAHAAIALFAFRQFRTLPFAVGACFTVVFFMGAWAPLRFEPDPYFQVMPIRFLFPALSVLLVGEWLRRPSWRGAIGISVLSGIAIVWNIDSGVAVAGSWIGLHSVQAAAAALARRPVALHAKRTAVAAAGILSPMILFAVWLRWRAGVPVDFATAVQSQQLFYIAGYYMLPMPVLWEAWEVVVAVYVSGFVIGSFHALGKIADSRAALILFVSILGLGLFPYYQGRSHERVLMAVVWPAVLVAFLIADWAWTLSTTGRLRHHIAAVVAAPTLAVGALAGFLLVRDVPGIYAVSKASWSGEDALRGVPENVAFIREHARGQRDVILLARFQAAYFAEAGLASSIRGPGVVEVVTVSQAAAILDEVDRHPTALLFIGRPYLEPGAGNPFNALLASLPQRYELVAKTAQEELHLYTRKR